MNKKLITLISTLAMFIMAVGLVSSSHFAQAQNGLLFGQNHKYSVVFRGNGEAIVYAKLAITNSEETPLTEFSFEIPNATATELTIFQQTLPQTCIEYSSIPSSPCIKYAEPDYSQDYYYGYYQSGAAEYQKAKFTQDGSRVKLTFPTAIQPNKSTALIISYAAKGYVKKQAGLHKFEFATLKVNSRIQNIRVAVDVDSDLYLKGKKAQVNYGVTAMPTDGLRASEGKFTNTALDAAVQQIGSYGPLVKEAKSLAPNETFLVPGEYANSWAALYMGNILKTIAIIVLVFVGLYLWYRHWKKRTPNNPNLPASTVPAQDSISLLNPLNAGMGLLSAVGIIVLSYLLSRLADSNLMYEFDLPAVMYLLMVIMVILVYLLIIFGPALYVAVKHGWKGMVSVVIAELLWLIILLIILFFLFASGSGIVQPMRYY